MKAYLTSIGEQTTDICKSQLERFGFEVILLDKKEDWLTKYKRFLTIAYEDCIRIDADIIPNKHIKVFQDCNAFLAKANVYDLYRNEVWPLSPVYYSKEALEILRKAEITDENRPETALWRSFKEKTTKLPEVVGIHGLGSNLNTIERAKKNKVDRKQIQDYDFDLVYKIISLYEKNNM